MKALLYHGLSKRACEDKTRPTIQDASDAIVPITASTICGEFARRFRFITVRPTTNAIWNRYHNVGKRG